MTKQTILTGLRANNDLHIGNYFGALLPLIDMATNRSNDFEINLFVPDLHSFTTPIDHSHLQSQIINNLKLFVAAGLPLNNSSVHIYRQSYIPAHSELTWILDCFTGFGEMSRMTQFKDKSSSLSADRTSVGLFNYPVLMAADMLLYDVSYVPVGDDQRQHLEFTRDIAQRMNAHFAESLFIVPEAVKDQHAFFGKEQGLRIKDLADPNKKMSKSDDSGKGIIFLGDNIESARKKIMSATTDTLQKASWNKDEIDGSEQPGIFNLLTVLNLLGGAPDSATGTAPDGYGHIKTVVADRVEHFLTDFQTKLAAVDERQLLAKLEADEQLMNQKANETLLRVQQAVGLRPQL